MAYFDDYIGQKAAQAVPGAKAAEQALNSLINTTPAGIAVVEVDPNDIAGSMHTTYYNDHFFSYSGYARAEYDALLQSDELHFVFAEDVPALLEATKKMCEGGVGVAADCTVRCHTKDGGYRWLLLTGQLARRRGALCVICVVLVDITDRKEAEDRERIQAEMLRIAAETDRRVLILYDIKANACRVESRTLFSASYGEVFENVPASLLRRGVAAPESEEELCRMFAQIRSGEPKISTSFRMHTGNGDYQWFECNATVVFDADGKPDHAVLVLHNITEQRIKEAVFKKWQQSIDTRPAESYTLFRCNLSRNAQLDEQDGALLKIRFDASSMSFDERTHAYAEHYVLPDDREAYTALLDADTLLAMFYRGEHIAALEYRELDSSGAVLWRRVTIEMVEYLNSTDVQAFLLYEDIDQQKRLELKERELAETDPLTGALNRVAFSARVDESIRREGSVQHALLMMDMDGFKLLNDTFGHVVGDQALTDTAAILRSLIREGDLICRLGGDEFMIWLRGVPYDAVVEKIARQMCMQVRKAFSLEVQSSASIGIAVYPRDGHNFDELYRSADKAMYQVKQTGKGSYLFASPGSGGDDSAKDEPSPDSGTRRAPKRRMLIVDDSEMSRDMLTALFEKEFLVEQAKNGTEALIRLRHFGAAASIVLLDLAMPGMDGFEVLSRMQNNVELKTIPVIVVSADDNYETNLRAIASGAADFVTKPVDANLIRLRVQSAVSKSENERLRAQNSYLQLQRDEELKYHTVLESTGTVVVEYNWHNHVFIYDNTISRYLDGVYNNRSLWQIFLSNMVADSADVQAMQNMMLTLANSKDETHASKLVLLRTPSKEKHWFRVHVYKQSDSFGLAEKMIITFNDVHEEVLTNERLLTQATRDELTGLYNRITFIEKAQEMIAAQEPGYYVMSCIDIENFKVLNDQYGTEKGDETLRRIAACIERAMQALGGICCRYTADNFGMLYPAAAQDSDTIRALHVNAAEAESSGRSIKIRIGRYLLDDLRLPVATMYDRATLAEESIRGRYDTNIAYYDTAMSAGILHEQQIVNDMDAALRQGEFEPWLQPQYNHATGALIGAEALVRWRKGDAFISPAEFIPVFERNGFIYEMDRCIWEQVCRLLRRWLDEGRSPLPVSVNISRRDLFHADFIDVITGLVKKYDIPISLLRLEVTESAFAESSGQVVAKADELIARGFTVEIDDFGSGYSSLNTLKDVPATILKLDMKFFENTENNQRSGNIVESVVRMAKWLGMAVIAEGVEDRAQADYLKSIGCYYIQGFVYAKPMPVADYEALLDSGGRAEPKLTHLQTLETLDNNEFWNPQSMETLIFNSYVGGACIFEFDGAKAEVLRINDQFSREFSGIFPVGIQLRDVDVARYLDEADHRRLLDAIRRADDTHKEAACEVKVSASSCTVYVRFTVRVIARAGQRILCYGVAVNMTELRAAQQAAADASDKLRTVMNHAGSGITVVALRKSAAQLLFANDKFYEIVGYTREDYATATREDFLAPIFPDDRDTLRRLVTRANAQHEGLTVEYRLAQTGGRIVWLRSVITITELPGVDAPVQIAVFSDITEEKEAGEQLQFLNDTAHKILAQPDAAQAIDHTLRSLTDYFDGQRAYVVELDHNRKTARNTYEICAGGVRSEMARLQDVPFAVTDYWFDILNRNEFVVIPDVAALEESSGELRTLLLSQDIQSLILAPLWRDSILVGYVGVDNPARAVNRLSRLAALGDYIAILLTRRDLHTRIDSDQAMMLSLMNDTPGGFVRMKRSPSGAFVPLFSNDGFTKLVGMSHQELQAIFGADVLHGVHPDDRHIVREAGERMVALGRAESGRFRARCGAGGYIWLTMYGRAVKDECGDVYLNVYYADASRQMDEEQKQRTLLDNLPSGAALYEYDGEKLSVIHINKRYWELVGRQPTDYADASFLNAIHLDDRAMVTQELRAAIRQKRDVSVDLRILHGRDGYVPFHIAARITREGGGTYLLYVSYSPISQEAMSMQEMLPMALATMMSASGDYSYVKGIDLRYIGCSRADAQMLGLAGERDIIGKTDHDLFSPELAAELEAEDRHILETGEALPSHMEKLAPKGGEIITVSASKYPITDAAGRVVGIYGVSHDITVEKRQASQLELLTASIPGGLATFVCEGAHIRLSYCNAGFCQLFGVSEEVYKQETADDPLHFVLEKDRADIAGQYHRLLDSGTLIDCIYRIPMQPQGGAYRWIHHRAAISERHEGHVVINAALFDITRQQEEKELLAAREEEYRLATKHSGQTICRFSIADRTLSFHPDMAQQLSLPVCMEDVPYAPVRQGSVSPDTAAAYTDFYERIMRGEGECTVTFQKLLPRGWRWVTAHATTIFAEGDKPVSAIISYVDVTEQQEKEAVYLKWQQSLQARKLSSYTLFRTNLNRDAGFDEKEGLLLPPASEDAGMSFNDHVRRFTEKYVVPEDRDAYSAFLNSDTMLASYYRGKRYASMDFRAVLRGDAVRWLRLTAELVEYPNSTEIQAYLLYEDITESKLEELHTRTEAERDPLTGLLNRKAFAEKADELLSKRKKDSMFALFLMDIDGFKLINDTFGHSVGDRVLIDVGRSIRSLLRDTDLVCRMGGDEFLVLLGNMPGRDAVLKKAQEIVTLARRSFDLDVHTSLSLGIALCPGDSDAFDQLYRQADKALYHVKAHGKDDCAFYGDMAKSHAAPPEDPSPAQKDEGKRRILVVDDNDINRQMLSHVFHSDFTVDDVSGGAEALTYLRRHRTEVAAVLLDLMMPGMDGFAVLESLRGSAGMDMIPVVVVSSDDNRETNLRAIRAGAADFVTKPVDAELLRLRVASAISRAENQRLRLQNHYLALQSHESDKLRSLLEDDGTALAEYSPSTRTFRYDRTMANHMAGVFDERPLWTILQADSPPPAKELQAMHRAFERLCSGKETKPFHTRLPLRAPSGAIHNFRVKLMPCGGVAGAGTILIAFTDLGEKGKPPAHTAP